MIVRLYGAYCFGVLGGGEVSLGFAKPSAGGDLVKLALHFNWLGSPPSRG